MSESVVERANNEPASRMLDAAEMIAIAQRWSPKLGDHAATGQLTDRRWYCRLEWNHDYEVWLLGWNDVQATDFHNHGGASGAVVVAAGALIESRIDINSGVRVKRRLVGQGHSFAFDSAVIHDVANADQGPSLSVHVYSPPLAKMTYFDVDDTSAIERETILVDGPEPDAEEIIL